MTRSTDCLCDCIAKLDNGTSTALSLADQALQRASDNESVNAFVCLDENIILRQAEASDARRQHGRILSSIDGIPIAVKDNYLTKDYPTTACSSAQPLEQANVDATIVSNLRNAGAIIFGKTNMHEWAFGATNSVSTQGPTNNPHNLAHITGGSSGGSAAAVATGVVPVALGSDTGGSVRIPAAACGIYGFKPSYGRASRFGVLPLSWSLDAPGPLTAALDDIPHLLPHFFGSDENDASTRHAKAFGQLPLVDEPRLVNLTGPGLERSEDVETVFNKALHTSGITVSNTGVSAVHAYFSAWEAILHAEASSYHGTLLATRAHRFSAITRAHLEAGRQLSAVELLRAQKIRGALQRELLELLGDRDALVLPTLPVVAPRHDAQWQEFGGRRVTTQDSMTWFCWLGNLAGLPCLTLPIGVGDTTSLPVGMMIMGRPHNDEHLLAVGQWLDKRMKTDRAAP